MFTSDAIAFFGSVDVVAVKAGVSRQAVGQWGEMVPPLSAAKLWKRSRGKLKFDPDLYDSWNNRKVVN